MFGEAFAFAEVHSSPVTLTAIEGSTILNIDFKNIINDSTLHCRYSKTIITNMLGIMAEKTLFLSSRLELITKKTIRMKLAAYFLQVTERAKCLDIEIPYNRNQLADFLSVNRSAISNELSKLRDEGILDFQKNKFTIHKPIVLSEIVNGEREEKRQSIGDRRFYSY